jgi:hypothetical protein
MGPERGLRGKNKYSLAMLLHESMIAMGELKSLTYHSVHFLTFWFDQKMLLVLVDANLNKS